MKPIIETVRENLTEQVARDILSGETSKKQFALGIVELLGLSEQDCDFQSRFRTIKRCIDKAWPLHDHPSELKAISEPDAEFSEPDPGEMTGQEQFVANEKKGTAILTLRTKTCRTLDEALEICGADLSVWKPERWIANKWDVVAKVNRPGDDMVQDLAATELWQVKVWFERKSIKEQSDDRFLEELRDNSKKVKFQAPVILKGKPTGALAISLMDPHLGQLCFQPQSDHHQSLTSMGEFYMFSVKELIRRAQLSTNIEKIIWVFGNDYFHTDNRLGTTTAGTPQPEAIDWHHTYHYGRWLAVACAEEIMQHAPCEAYQVPGNHDELASYTMGLTLESHFWNNPNFWINANASQFKTFVYGKTGILLEHGKISSSKYSGLFANVLKKEWADTTFNEVWLGDQHRQAASKPSTFEEQGVSVWYMPGLTAPNKWHRNNGYNFQKRAACGLILEREGGVTNRLNLNISQYTGEFYGEAGERFQEFEMPDIIGEKEKPDWATK